MEERLPDEYSVITEIDNTAKFHDDYHKVVIHIALLRNDMTRYLLFGLLQLIPNERKLSIAHWEAEPFRIGQDREYLHCERFILNLDEALLWYKRAINEGVVTYPPTEIRNEEIRLGKMLHSDFYEEPIWPRLTCSFQVPFKPIGSSSVRTHSLLQFQNSLLSEVKDYVSNKPEILNVIKKDLGFDLTECKEYIGSLNFIAVNPVLRACELRMSPVDESFRKVFLHLVPRAGFATENLEILFTEERCNGISDTFLINHRAFGTIELNYNSEPWKIGVLIRSQNRGIIHYINPSCFIKKISISMGVMGPRKIVMLPSRSEKNSSTKYSVDLVSEDIPINIGMESAINGCSILMKAKNKRDKEKQKVIILKDRHKSEQAIRELFKNAKKQVLIIDPYFATREVYNFALSTTRMNCSVSILTSRKCLIRKLTDIDEMAGEWLHKHIIGLKGEHESLDITVSIMKGEHKIHDRFIVIDGQKLWMIGSSLNNIGTQISTLVKIDNNEELINEIEQAMKNSELLESWLNRRLTPSTDTME